MRPPTPLCPEALVQLIEAAYEAALDESLWPAFLERFAESFHGQNTALVVQDLRSPQNYAACCVRTDPEWFRQYNEYFYTRNPWLLKGSADLASGGVFVGETHCPAEDLVRTEFYNDWLRPQHLKHAIAAVILTAASQVVVCSTLRTVRAGSFYPKDAAFYEAVLPHVRRALLANHHARNAFQSGRAALEILEGLPVGCVLVDWSARALFVNRVAREILDARSGLSLCAAGLIAARHQDNLRLCQLIHQAIASPPSGGEMTIARERVQPLLILVSPLQGLRSSVLRLDTPVAVWITDPSREVVPAAQRIRGLFRLTKAEASLATELVRGLSLYEIADILRISRHTARNHLKSIFDKIGVHRQVDLVRRLLSLPT